jgi:hypothetical protein
MWQIESSSQNSVHDPNLTCTDAQDPIGAGLQLKSLLTFEVGIILDKTPLKCGDKVSENGYFLSSFLSQRWEFPLHSEAAVSGGSTEESSTLILL